jgi:hypothetical protein
MRVYMPPGPGLLGLAAADGQGGEKSPDPADPAQEAGAAPTEDEGDAGRILHGGRLRPRFGVQAGALFPMAGAHRDFEPGPLGALVLRFGAHLAKDWGLELGAGYSRSDAVDADASVELIVCRARALRLLSPAGVCLAAGAQAVVQRAEERGIQLDHYVGASVDLGVVWFFAERFEVGIACSILVPSDNVPGMLEFITGVSF